MGFIPLTHPFQGRPDLYLRQLKDYHKSYKFRKCFFPGITEPGADGVGIVGTIPPDHSRKKTPGCLGRGKVPRGGVHAAKISRTSAKEIGSLYYKYPQRLCQLSRLDLGVAFQIHLVFNPVDP